MRKQNSRPHRQQSELFGASAVKRKLRNLTNNNSDYSTDTDSDSVSNSDPEYYQWTGESRFKNDRSDGIRVDASEALPRIRRSETFRARYIDTKEIRICTGTWNVGGRIPPDDLDLDGWLDIDKPADIYVIGLQEIISLSAGNIFGTEDRLPVPIWENIIRETLNKIPPVNEFKCYSNPPSPSRFKPSEDAPNIDEILQTDSDIEKEIPVKEDSNFVNEIKDGTVTGENFVYLDASVSINKQNLGISVAMELQHQFSSPIMLDKLNCFRTEDSEENIALPSTQYINKLARMPSGIERNCLSWPEPPLHLLGQHALERTNSFKSFKSNMASESRMRSDIASLAELDLESLLNPKKRSPYIKIVSKQMVGVFLTIWVRRSLRRHIQNINVSSVGVGNMRYKGNKGSISVSMSIYQTLFCFICTHLTSGERDVDAAKRIADVQEIHRQTRFNLLSSIGLPKNIRDHERIIWLGDLNYRINLSYEQTKELISKKDWAKLVEHDQLIKELRKGRAFNGWSEGTLNFAPTYKYQLNSDTYCGEDSMAERRIPSWCDRVLSFGKGMKLLSYRRNELWLSDHRPVTASYMVEVEVFSPKKLQRALTFTDAEIDGNWK